MSIYLSLIFACGGYDPDLSSAEKLCDYLINETAGSCDASTDDCVEVACYGNSGGPLYRQSCESNNTGDYIEWVSRESLEIAEISCEDEKDAGFAEVECVFTDEEDGSDYTLTQVVCNYNLK